jgi:hypothetical protein
LLLAAVVAVKGAAAAARADIGHQWEPRVAAAQQKVLYLLQQEHHIQ